MADDPDSSPFASDATSRPSQPSTEVGRLGARSRVVVGAGMALVAGGLLTIMVVVAVGLQESRSGGPGTDVVVPWMPIGFASVVVGFIVAAAGMSTARRAAGE